MLNALWAFMMLTGLGWAAVHGTLGAVTEGMLAAAGDAVSLGITMLGVMAFWTGILEIGRRAGLIEQLSAGMRPVLHFLFPRIPAGHPALSSMAANMIAYRSQYGSAHPLAVAGPAFLATCVSTLAGVAVCRVMCRRKQYKSIKKDVWK